MSSPELPELLDLLIKCRPFVWRAMQGGKVPHTQDKLDAEKLWPMLDGLDQLPEYLKYLEEDSKRLSLAAFMYGSASRQMNEIHAELVVERKAVVTLEQAVAWKQEQLDKVTAERDAQVTV